MATVNAVSYDGKTIVGQSDNRHAYIWSVDDGFTDVGTLGGAVSGASGVSDNGNAVVGYAYNSANEVRAFLWTKAGNMQDLGTLPGDAGAWANGISGDGQVVVGATYKVGPSYAADYKAVRWDVASGTITDLGSLGGTISQAYAANRDGSVIVGSSQLIDGQTHAFRWTEAGGMQDLDKTPGNSSVANDVNADGSVVVGQSGDTAFRWTEPTGMTSLGVLSGQSYSIATNVSDDGNTVVGDSGGRAFIWNAAFGTPAGVIQDLDHLQTSLIQSADTVNQLVSNQTRRLRDLTQQQCQPGINQTYCLGGGRQSYAGGADNSDYQNDLQLSGGLRFNEQFTAGATLSIGASTLKDQDAEQNKAFGLGLWSAYQQNSDNTGWGGSASVALGKSDNTFERGVGLTDVQRARANLKMSSTAVRVAAHYGVQVGTSLVTPEVSLSHARTGQDGFTERNVAFPLTVDSSKSSQTYATVGVRSATPINAKGTLHLSLAVDTLLHDQTPAIEGHSNVPGLSRFKLDGRADKRRVVPMGALGYSHALDENSTLGVGLQLSGGSFKGDRSVIGVGVKYSYAF
ncbi:autotransporter domain-containing protein [Pseudomonas sp. GV071]|uniref:autotransporter domain-containing protein n=1 Tax=Pseudomonas sp. GV071 TaxID=2135754 RepID=UPI001304FEEB|nr:autotransporter domain-containing protein [Pseudomonas sp. GV071]